jgi:hypothetical protein
MRRCAGSRFDRRVVDAILGMLGVATNEHNLGIGGVRIGEHAVGDLITRPDDDLRGELDFHCLGDVFEAGSRLASPDRTAHR